MGQLILSTSANEPFDTEELTLMKINASGGGGVVGGGEVLSGAGAPSANPGVASALYIDTNTGQLYEWYSGAWH